MRNLISKGIITAGGIGSGTYYILEDDKVNDNEKVAIDNEKVAISDDKIVINDDEVVISDEELAIRYKNLNLNEIKIMEYLHKNPQIANRDARKLLGLSASGVDRIFRIMQSKKLIVKQGNNRNRTYRLNINLKEV